MVHVSPDPYARQSELTAHAAEVYEQVPDEVPTLNSASMPLGNRADDSAEGLHAPRSESFGSVLRSNPEHLSHGDLAETAGFAVPLIPGLCSEEDMDPVHA